MLEMMPKSYQPTVTSVWAFVEGSVYVLAILYFMQVSKNWFYFVSIGYAL